MADSNVTYQGSDVDFDKKWPPLGDEWEAELWAQIEQWKLEQRASERKSMYE